MKPPGLRAVMAAVLPVFISMTEFLESKAPPDAAGVALKQDDRIIMAAPASLSFRVDQVPKPQSYATKQGQGAIALARAYSKYGVPVPEDLASYIEQIWADLQPIRDSSAGTKTKDEEPPLGEVTAMPQSFDSDYICQVQIGTPPQTLYLDFDTASSDLWVFSSETPADQSKDHTIYNIHQSSTAQLLNGESWNIQYADGSSSGGNIYSDVVSIGGVAVENQAIGSATRVSQSLSDRQNTDGIVGLAFNLLNTARPEQKPTFFDNVMKSLSAPLFTANLKASEPGNYHFGFINTTEFTGSITYAPVNASAGFWQFTTQGFKIGDSTLIDVPHDAIADTGTTLMLLPEYVTAAYYSKVPGAVYDGQNSKGYVFPCSTVLPNYTAVIGPYEAVVPGKYINHSPVDGGSFENATTCFGGIQAAPSDLPFAIYGDVFLKSQFIVFHGGNTQLGFAAKPLS